MLRRRPGAVPGPARFLAEMDLGADDNDFLGLTPSTRVLVVVQSGPQGSPEGGAAAHPAGAGRGRRHSAAPQSSGDRAGPCRAVTLAPRGRAAIMRRIAAILRSPAV